MFVTTKQLGNGNVHDSSTIQKEHAQRTPIEILARQSATLCHESRWHKDVS